VTTLNKLQEYIKRKIEIENKYCSGLPLYDSEGRYCGGKSSFIDSTGKFDSELRKEIVKLNQIYKMPYCKSK
jgi:hypothetical protein